MSQPARLDYRFVYITDSTPIRKTDKLKSVPTPVTDELAKNDEITQEMFDSAMESLQDEYNWDGKESYAKNRISRFKKYGSIGKDLYIETLRDIEQQLSFFKLFGKTPNQYAVIEKQEIEAQSQHDRDVDKYQANTLQTLQTRLDNLKEYVKTQSSRRGKYQNREGMMTAQREIRKLEKRIEDGDYNKGGKRKRTVHKKRTSKSRRSTRRN